MREREREREKGLTTKKEKLIKNGFVDEQCIKVLVEQNEFTVTMLNFF
jgi:mannitol/fructose-specific phosphotransferase system IIA component